MRKIAIYINEKRYEAELNETRTAQMIYGALPIKAKGNFWGEEIYFKIPVEFGNEKPTEDVKVGDLAYWPDGNGFCIFYGITPASVDGKPRPASPVTIVGKIKGDLEEFKRLAKAKIRIEKSR